MMSFTQRPILLPLSQTPNPCSHVLDKRRRVGKQNPSVFFFDNSPRHPSLTRAGGQVVPRRCRNLPAAGRPPAVSSIMAASPPPPEALLSVDRSSSRAFSCLICLEDCVAASRASPLHCDHAVCKDCLRRMWTYNIVSSSDPFPRCPSADCGAYASLSAVASLVPPKVLQKLHQLRRDGRHRTFCISEVCMEEMPPPPPPLLSHEKNCSGEAAEEQWARFVSTCPACGQGLCTVCERSEHGTGKCVQSLAGGTSSCGIHDQDRLYQWYAISRVAECPRCGVHIERNGGCRSIVCQRCKCRFFFRPFKSAVEVEESMARWRSPAAVFKRCIFCRGRRRSLCLLGQLLREDLSSSLSRTRR